MKNDNDFKIFLFVGFKKLVITALNSNNQNIYKKELLNNNSLGSLNFDIINKFLEENIFNIEKALNKFVNNIFLIIDHNDFFSVDLSLKKKTNVNQVNNDHINSLLIEAKNQCKKTLENNKIIHLKVDKFIIDNIEYSTLPKKICCNNFSIDVSFICLPSNLIKKYEKIFSKYQIYMSRIISYRYLCEFLKSKEDDIFEVAVKILNGVNENEVLLINKSQVNKGFFEKFFSYFN
mgnify:FL=1